MRGMTSVPVTANELLLAALAVIFILPWLLWKLARADLVLPLVVVQIVTGIALGPGIAGSIAPAWHAALFTQPTIAALTTLGMWGVILFVFTAGVELDLGGAWERRREASITASLALCVPFVLGIGAALALLAAGGSGWLGENGTRVQFAAGVGMACAVTALPILVLLLEQLRLFDTRLGQRVLAYASLDDVALWGLLSLVLLDWERLARQGMYLALFAPAAWLVRRVLARASVADRWPLALFWLAANALLADWAGLHFMVGAFLAGLVIDARMLGEEAVVRFRGVVLLALMPIFFLSTGLRTGWEMGGVAIIGAAALLLAAAVGGKLLGVALAGRVLGWARGEAAVIGWLLQTKALIMIVFANVLLDRAIISDAAFTALLLMAVASTVLTMPQVRRVMARGGVAAG
jgi:Kef-type K+ transport system membrane component KefB